MEAMVMIVMMMMIHKLLEKETISYSYLSPLKYLILFCSNSTGTKCVLT